MKVQKEPKKMGRPRVSPDSKQMKITISSDDYDLLKRVASLTASNPTAIVRDLLNESRPVFNAVIEAIEASNLQKSAPSGTLADKMLKHALLDKEPSQQELLDMLHADEK